MKSTEELKKGMEQLQKEIEQLREERRGGPQNDMEEIRAEN